MLRSFSAVPGASGAVTLPESQAQEMGYYDEWGDYIPSVPPEHVKLAKSLEAVNYRKATEEEGKEHTHCYGCRFYQWGLCHLVEGTIEADDLCNLYTPDVKTYPDMTMYAAAGAESGAYALFLRPALFAANSEEPVEGVYTPPEWFDYYPAPGVFYHEVYGDIVITPEGNQAIVDNFTQAIFQDELPIDCEHDLESSGAVGYIQEMRIGERGQVEARAEWNSRGLTLLGDKRFKYFSPQLWPSWSKPEDPDTIYTNIAIGGAICVRPFFNQRHLTPLVATAGGALDLVDLTTGQVSEADTLPRKPVSVIRLSPVSARQVPTPQEVPMEGQETKTATNVTTAAPVTSPANQFSAAEVQAFQAFQAAGGAEAFTRMQGELTQAREATDTLRKERRSDRFKAIVLGREGSSDGAPWTGSVEYNVKMLEHLADTSAGGEESDLFKSHLEVKQAEASAARGSKIFSEVGHGSRPEQIGGTATEKRDALLNQYSADGLSDVEAAQKLSKEHPDIYRAAAREIGREVN